MNLTIDCSDLERAADEWAAGVRALRSGMRGAVEQAARVGRGAMRNEAPRKTGRLDTSIDYTISSTDRSARAVIRPHAPYARFVIDGTEPHLIEARGGGVLAFDVAGSRVFTRFVHHPGTRPNDFVIRAAPWADEALDREVHSLIESALARFL